MTKPSKKEIVQQFALRKAAAIARLAQSVGPVYRQKILNAFAAGDYKVRLWEEAPEPYDSCESEVCWGVLYTHTFEGITATFAHGECKGQPFDPEYEGLIVWVLPQAVAADYETQ